MKIHFITISLLLSFVVAHGQAGFADTRMLYSVADTISRDKTSVTLNVKWMDSPIQIRKTTRMVYDLEYQRKLRKDPTYYPTREDSLRFMNLMETFTQNCHSYALEKYFDYHHIVDSLFTKRTVVTENMYMDNILMAAFRKEREVKTKPARNLKAEFKEGSLIVFRNKSHAPIHAVFYDGKFHTKNGGWASRTEESLKPIFKKYWDTEVIEGYQVDREKVGVYLKTKTQ